jgi:hypothetical protein
MYNIKPEEYGKIITTTVTKLTQIAESFWKI